jgi:chromosomal replication initiation ATPase DnaA
MTGLREAVPEGPFEMYLAGVEPVRRENGHVVVRADDKLSSWVRERFGGLLNRVVSDVAGVRVEVVIEETESERQAADEAAVKTARRAARTRRTLAAAEVDGGRGA